MVVTERWLHSDIIDSEICPPECCVLRCGRGSGSDGVVIFSYKRCLSCVRIVELTDLEEVLCRVGYGKLSLNIRALCRPPNSFIELKSKVSDLFVEYVHHSSSFIVAED